MSLNVNDSQIIWKFKSFNKMIDVIPQTRVTENQSAGRKPTTFDQCTIHLTEK